MYTSRFDEAQMAYCKWMKSCKTFADLIRTIEVSACVKFVLAWVKFVLACVSVERTFRIHPSLIPRPSVVVCTVLRVWEWGFE